MDADDPAKGLPGAVIRIEGVDNSFSGSYTTGAGGYLENVPWDTMELGSYNAIEVTPPAGYSLSSDPSKVKQSFTWDGKTDVALVFEDDAKVKVRLVKQDASGNPLAGAVFHVLKDGQIIASEATDEDGTITVTNITEGMFAFFEAAAPEGYAKLEAPACIYVDQATVEGGGTVTVTAVDKALPQLTLRKEDADSTEPVPGTVFTVEGIDNDYKDDWTTGPDGTITGYVQPGTYKITEKSVPSPYLLDWEGEERSLRAGETYTVVAKDHRAPSIEIIKSDSVTGDPLSNVRIQVWYASNHTETGEYNDLGVFTTDENGRIVLTEPQIQMRDGWYKVKELEPLKGYGIKDSDTQEAFVPAGKSHTFRIENTPLSAIAVWKFDDVTKEAIPGCTFQLRYLGGDTSGTGGTVIGTYTTSANGSFTVTGLKAGYYIIEEVASDADHVISCPPQTVYISGKDQDVVQVYFGNAPKGNVLVKKVSAKDGAPLSDVEFLVTEADGTLVGDANGKFVTDSSGSFLVEGLDPGTTLVIKETRAKPGYLLDNVPQTVIVKPGRTVTLEYRNQPLGKLVLHKLSSKDKSPLEGVQFKITYADGSYVDAEGGQLSSKGLYWTDADGQIVLDGITGTLIATEVQSVPGYTIHEETRSQTVVVNPGDTQELYFYNASLGGIELVKVDATDRTKRIPNVTFEIRKMDDALIDTITTDKNGRAFLALEDGAYYAVEIDAPKQYRVDPTPIYFEVKGGKTVTKTVTNQPFSGILLRKIDSVTGKGIYGATFLVYDGTMHPIDQITTDQDGYAYLDSLDFSGKLFLRELEAEGYIVDTRLKTVYVKPGETTLVEWENTPITAQIQITKKSADYNSTNGLPAGTLLEGAVFEIYDKAGNLVDTIRSNSQGLAVSKQLPLDRYTIREVKAPANYGVNEKELTAYLEYAGQILRFEVTDKSLSTSVSITKTGPKEIMAGQPVRYTFSNIANTSNVRLDNFYWSPANKSQAPK